ncbi:MAG: FKBP-type peptidyl-prolyl cis-trans isomerase [Casimicrobiaceae bacterium]
MNIDQARNSKLSLLMLAAVIAGGLPGTWAAEPPPAAAPAKPPMKSEEASYDVGLMLGSQLQHNGAVPALSLDTVIRGLKDSVGGRVITSAERDAALRFMREAHDALVGRNNAAAVKFMEHNAKQPGIVSMPSGLQYRVIAQGDPHGRSPAATDDVTVRYRATLADGTEVDRSDLHDRPATFRVGSVIKGWREALLAMPPGAKWQLFVPPELAYGSNPPPAVPPGALLVYELELLRIEAAAPLDPAAAKRRPAAGARPAVPSTPP